ncbi:MAG: type III pantothenate kinase [Planctomycetes bacterium]|nr:type III pantothenate kinase [Planctomycetota bacterium]
MTSEFSIAIDIGNSRIKIGRFTHGEGSLPECCESHVFLLSDESGWATAVGRLAEESHPRAGVIAGSNHTGIEAFLKSWPAAWPQPIEIRSSEHFPLEINVDEPRRVGLDRLLNSVAVNRLRDDRPADDRPAVIVDCGTATTVDCVSASGAFEGGAILPGFGLSARALNEYTDALPLVSFEELASQAAATETLGPAAFGKNTRAAIQSGIFWGQIGAIRELVERMTAGGSCSPQLFLTGGGSSTLAPFLPDAVHCPFLPLQGMLLVAKQVGASRNPRRS